MPLISIVTVVYNAENVIEDTIKSLLAQTFTNYEYIIIDGQSTDNTHVIIDTYRTHITTYISEPDKGIYDAMNKGLSLASGKWVYFLNAGDRFYNSDVLQKISQNYLADEKAIICGRVKLVDNFKNKLLTGYYPLFEVHGRNFRKLFTSAFCHQALLIPRKAYNEVDGFNLQFKTFSDFNTVVNILNQSYKVKYVDDVISEYDINGTSANWKKAKPHYHEKEKILALAGEKKRFPLNIIGLIKLEFFVVRKKIAHARFK